MTVTKTRATAGPLEPVTQPARLGPRAAADRGAVLSPAQSAVLDELTMTPDFRLVSDLAATLGQHTNTVREHLDSLVEAGLVVRRVRKASGRGRPATEYQARPVEQTQPTLRQYAALVSALASHIESTSDDPSSEALAVGVAWGQKLAVARSIEGSGTAAKRSTAARRQVVQIMSELGFAPEADSRAAMVRLRRCPLLGTAKAHPEVVCGVHLGVVRGALQAMGGDSRRADLVPFAEVGACRLNLLALREPKKSTRVKPTA
jgi:predicted ArsR family transcriptional regulator